MHCCSSSTQYIVQNYKPAASGQLLQQDGLAPAAAAAPTAAAGRLTDTEARVTGPGNKAITSLSPS